MKRFLIAIFLLTAVSAFAQPAPAPLETVTVTGTGRSSIPPDRFTFTVGVQTLGTTVDLAVAENNKRVADVIAALKRAGAPDKDIQTSNFNIFPQQEYSEGRPPRIVGYQVHNSVTVRSSKIADAGRWLGVAIAAGVNNASGINFEVSDPARGRDQGLKGAFDDAKAKATLLAQAAGRSLGRTVHISEGVQNEPPRPYPMAQAAEMRMAKADVPVEPGSQELTYTITATFELR